VISSIGSKKRTLDDLQLTKSELQEFVKELQKMKLSVDENPKEEKESSNTKKKRVTKGKKS